MRALAAIFGVLMALSIGSAALAGPMIFVPQAEKADPYTQCGTDGSVCPQQ